MHVNIRRNIVNDVREFIEAEIANSGPSYVAAIVATRVIERLRVEDPELLNKWLELNADEVVRRMIADIERAKRHHARASAERKTKSVFSTAMERYAQGEENALGAWLDTTFVVTTAFERKHLRDMDRDDLLFASHQYTERARISSMQAAFLRSIADYVGARTVGEVFDNDRLNELWRSLT
jgi:hypothetical protein